MLIIRGAGGSWLTANGRRGRPVKATPTEKGIVASAREFEERLYIRWISDRGNVCTIDSNQGNPVIVPAGQIGLDEGIECFEQNEFDSRHNKKRIKTGSVSFRLRIKSTPE